MTDEELVLAFLAGDRPAFDAFFERYREPIWAFFHRRRRACRGGGADAGDFLAVLKAARRYEPRSSFRSYLFGIAFNVLSASRRKAQRKGDVSAPDLDGLAGASSDPAAVLWVRQALAALNPQDREIVMLREYDALDYREIALVIDVPVNTVRSRLFRARLALREKLAGEPHATGVKR